MILSVIIPTYNSSAVIGRALDSILRQTFTDWEVLVMDGDSEDDTVSIAQSYNDNRIRIFSEPDKGIYDAMNKGIEKSKGEWLYFLGSDDYLLNDKVLDAVFSKEIESYDVVYGDVESTRLDERNFGEWKIKDIEFNRCHQCVFYKRSFFEKVGLYNIRYRVLADYDMNLNWLLSSKVTSKYIQSKIAYFSDGGFSNSCYDESFYNEYSLKIIRLGFWKLPISQRLLYLKKVVDIYPHKTIRCVYYPLFYLTLLEKKCVDFVKCKMRKSSFK